MFNGGPWEQKQPNLFPKRRRALHPKGPQCRRQSTTIQESHKTRQYYEQQYNHEHLSNLQREDSRRKRLPAVPKLQQNIFVPSFPLCHPPLSIPKKDRETFNPGEGRTPFQFRRGEQRRFFSNVTLKREQDQRLHHFLRAIHSRWRGANARGGAVGEGECPRGYFPSAFSSFFDLGVLVRPSVSRLCRYE